MELSNYYSMDECVDRKKVTTTLKKYVKEGKIEYNLDKTTDVLQLQDLDLEEEDIDDYKEKPKSRKNEGTKRNTKKNGGTRKKYS